MHKNKLADVSVDVDVSTEELMDMIDTDAIMNSVYDIVENFAFNRLKKVKDACNIKKTLNVNLDIELIGNLSSEIYVLCKPIKVKKIKNYFQINVTGDIDTNTRQQFADLFNSDEFEKPVLKLNIDALIQKQLNKLCDDINNEILGDEAKKTLPVVQTPDEIEKFLNKKFPKTEKLGWLGSDDYELAVKLVGECLEKDIKIDVNNELISHYVRSIHNEYLLGFDYGESPKKSTIQKSIKVLEFIHQNYPNVSVTTLDTLEKFYELSGRYEDALSCFATYITQTKIISTYAKDSILRIKYKGNMPVTVNELLSVTKPATKFITDKQNEFISEANSIYSGFNIAGYTDFLQYIGNKYNKTLKKNFYTFRTIEEFSDYCSYLSRTAENKLREKYGQRLLKLDPEYAKYKWYK